MRREQLVVETEDGVLGEDGRETIEVVEVGPQVNVTF